MSVLKGTDVAHNVFPKLAYSNLVYLFFEGLQKGKAVKNIVRKKDGLTHLK